MLEHQSLWSLEQQPGWLQPGASGVRRDLGKQPQQISGQGSNFNLNWQVKDLYLDSLRGLPFVRGKFSKSLSTKVK